MPHSCERRLPLRWLQRLQAATTLSQTSLPPRDFGTTWSRVSAASGNTPPQYRQRLRSRPNSARLVSGGTLRFCRAMRPPQAMMLCTSIVVRLPSKRERPPRSRRMASPRFQTTRSRAYRQTASCQVAQSTGWPDRLSRRMRGTRS